MTEYGLHIPPKVLIDTHIFIWLIDADPRLPQAAIDVIYDRQNVLLLSHASVWEVMIKAQLGKFKVEGIDATEPFIKYWANHYHIDFLPIRIEHIFRLRQLYTSHKDPFDRILMCQAEVEMLPLLTVDPQMKYSGIKTIGV